MSSRSIRRAAERKARKLQRKQERLASRTNLAAPDLPTTPQPASLQDEFSPELIAEARAIRERIAARVAASAQATPPASPAPPSRTRMDEPAPFSEAKTRLDEPAPFSEAKTRLNEPAPFSEAKTRLNEPAFLSEAKTRSAINRANAQYSTGPVTPAGKLASSRNSLKHGLASGTLIIPGEDPAEFEALSANLLNDFQPANSTEELLVRQMAQSHWLTQRAIRLQNGCFTPEGVDQKQLALFLRYQTTHERAFYKALNSVIRLQRAHRASGARCARSDMDHRHESRGFVSQTAASGGFVSQRSSTPPQNSPAEPSNGHSAGPLDNEMQGVDQCLNRSAAKR